MILNSDQNCDLNNVSKFGPPIHLAVTSEQDEIVQYLLDKKVNLKLRDKDENTVLHHSIRLNLFRSGPGGDASLHDGFRYGDRGVDHPGV